MCKYNSISEHFLAHFLYASGVRLYDGPDFKLFLLVGIAGVSCQLLGPPGFNWGFAFAPYF